MENAKEGGLESALRYVQKEKAIDWLGLSMPIPSQGLNSLAKVIENFENPKLPEEKKQSESKNAFKPVSRKSFDKLIERLKKSGLARNVFVDSKKMREYLEGRFGEEGKDKNLMFQVLLDPRMYIPKVRGGWTKDKIVRELKRQKKDSAVNTNESLIKYIAKFDTPQELREYLFYHGTGSYVSGNLYPSITMSEREAEEMGGGGYGERYWAISLSTDKNISKNFSGQSRSVLIYPVLLNKDAKVIDMQGMEDSVELEDIIEQLWNDKVDAVRLGKGGEKELAVINPNAISVFHSASKKYNVFGIEKLQELTDDELQNTINNARKVVVDTDNFKKENPLVFPERSEMESKERLEDTRRIKEKYKAKIREIQESTLAKYPVSLMATPKGEVYGFVTPEGDVYIDPKKLNANTPIHEYGHLFWPFMPEERRREITELMKKTPGWEKISSNPAYANLKTDDSKSDELFNTLLGNYGEHNQRVQEIIGNDITLFARIQNSVNEFLNWLKALFGNTDAKLNQFTKQTLGELLGGKSLINHSVESNEMIIKERAQEIENFLNDTDEGKKLVAQAVEAKTSMIAQAKKVSDFIHDVLDGKVKSGKQTIELPETANRLAEKALGHPIESHSIKADEIRHINKGNGIEGQKNNAKSIPLRKEDIALLPYIMGAPDHVIKGTPTREGAESVRYIKELSNGRIMVVEREISPDSRNMENITMWADTNRLTTAASANLKGTSATTSETHNAESGKNHSANATVATNKSTPPTTSETNISQNDAAKIKKDFEIAVEKEQNPQNLIRFAYGKFRDEIDQDEIYGLLEQNTEYTNEPHDILSELEKYYSSPIESASSGASYAMKNGLIPFAGSKYAGENEEYHHFRLENGDVVSVPFKKAYNYTEPRFKIPITPDGKAKVTYVDSSKNGGQEAAANQADYDFDISGITEERRASLAEETEDVARGDQLFIYDGLGANNSELTKPQYKDFKGDVLAFAKATNDWNEQNRNSLNNKNKEQNNKNSSNFVEQNIGKNGNGQSVSQTSNKHSASQLFDRGAQNEQRGGNEISVKNTFDELRGRIETTRKEQSGLSKHEVNDLEKWEALNYAKENGLWIDDLYSLGEPFPGGGNENTLAFDEKTGMIFKSNNLFNSGYSIQNLLNSVSIHNELFPETSYDLVGFTGIDNGIKQAPYIEVILNQKYVPNAEQATPQEIADYMQSLGFEKVNDHTFTNGQYTVSDLRPRNVLKNADGNIFVVDDIITENSNVQSVQETDSDVRFQVIPGNPNTPNTQQYREELDKKLNTRISKFAESWQDRYLPVREFLDVLRKAGTDINDYMDFHLQATHLSGKNDAGWESYYKQFQQPLNEVIHKLTEKGLTLRDVENYAILKHGLERNDYMSQKDISEGKNPKPDYSGIKAVEKEIEKTASDYISEFETKAGNQLVDEFWKKVKDATDFSIKKQMESGLISKQTYDDLKSRYQYYIPLRGHDQKTAENIWDYSPDTGTYFSAPIITANGRISRSETPFAYIPQMAQSAIVSGNKNTLNMTMKRLASVDKTGLISVNMAWFDVNTGESLEPKYSENAEQYRQNIEDFEKDMEAKEKKGLVTHNRSSLDINGLFIKPSQKEQHTIRVYQNGKSYNVYINGNPAVSRAVNGQNIELPPKIAEYTSNVTRFMAANFTTRNPAFVLSNMSRDYLFSSSILSVKEDLGYALKFQGNLFSGKSGGALLRYLQGRMDMNRAEDRYLSEYIMNGAKTGFSHIVELKNIQKRIERDIKTGNKNNMGDLFLNAVGSCNDFSENLCRFSVYMASRESGRSVARSVSDAKELTVNFNRRGAGGYGASFFTPLYLFSNAAIQALANFGKVSMKHKGKAALMITSYAITGFIMPFISSMIGGDDGPDEYMKIPDWDRQNNLCIYNGIGFIKIPLPQELRVFHKIGDEIFQTVYKGKDSGDVLKESVLGLLDLVPINPVGNVEQGSWAEAFPDFARPFVQLGTNKTFSGRDIANKFQDMGANANKPGYTKVKTNKRGDTYAPGWMIDFLGWANGATGGDEHKAGLIGNLKWGNIDLTNPDKLNHVLNGYFGGLYDIGIKTAGIAEKVYNFKETGKIDIKTREIPVVNRFWTSTDDTFTSNSVLQNRFMKAKESYEESNRLMKAYGEDLKKGKISKSEFEEKTKDIGRNNKIMDSYRKDYLSGRLSISEYADKTKDINLKAMFKQIKNYEDKLKDFDKDEQRRAEVEISRIKQMVVDVFYGEDE